MMKLNIPTFCFVNTKCKKYLSEKPPLLISKVTLYISIVVEYGPRSQLESGVVTNCFGVLKRVLLISLPEW